ncbi:MAG: UDP-glucose 4-epimerase GalE, partial [bacterium]
MASRVLVTGGAGYIGSHACKALAKAGYEPVSYDNMVYGHEELVKWGPLEVGDILDGERLRVVIDKYYPDVCMHFAAFTYVGESVEDPAKYYKNNVLGTINLLEALRENGIKKLIFSSSAAVYGNPVKTPIPDDHYLSPVNPYGETKRVMEGVMRDFGGAYGLKSASLRYFNASGADPEGESGELHDPETHLIPLVLQVAAGKREHITVFGDDYDTPDGTCVRDYIHVTDLADAHVRALEKLDEGDVTRAYNLGNGNGFSVLEVIETARKVTGHPIPAEIGPRRAGDPPVLVADSSRIKEELGWRPVYTDLEAIIETAWKFC